MRTQQETSADTLKRYGEAVELLEEAAEQVATAQQRETENAVKPLLKGLIEVADTQTLAAKELQRVLAGLNEILARSKQDATEAAAAAPRLPFSARLSGAGHVLTRQQQLIERLESRLTILDMPNPRAEQIRARVEAAASGLSMGLQRIERTMRQHGLEPIAAIGRPFDPELMEVIDTIADTGKPAGEVVDEFRRGYLWNGNVFRFAQVRVAK